MIHFIKLGGSLITDKNKPMTPRPAVINRLAAEIAAAWRSRPHQKWVLSHGSGSYGHVAGKRHGIRNGVRTPEGWQGFVETGHVAGQLNRLVLEALLQTGLPVISLPPSALAWCRDGRIVEFWSKPVQAALENNLIPLLFGDVAFDETRGGVIISTEEVLAALARDIAPQHLTLVGVVDGVYDADPLRNPQARPIPHISISQLHNLSAELGGSHGVDVTGGMAGKVQEMAELIRKIPDLKVHLLSGEIPMRLQEHLQDPTQPLGTTLSL